MGEPINKKIALEQSAPVQPIENPKSYSNMLQGKATNAIAKASIKRASVDPITGTGEIMTADNVKVFISSFNSVKLDVPARKILDILTLELTSNFPYGKEVTTDDINKHRAVSLSLDDYMNDCGLKDRKEAREQLKEGIRAIYNISLEWTETRYIVPEGKKRTKKVEKPYSARIISLMGGLENNPVKNGKVDALFTMEIAEYLSKAYIMPYPNKLLTVNAKYTPHSYYIGRRLAEHHNMNVGKDNANHISVKSLIEALPDLPRYSDIMESNKHVSKLIIKPFERDLSALKDKYGILESWNYCTSKGEPLTEEQTQNYSYETWVQWQVEFRLTDYPDQSERLAKIAERKRRARERRRKQENDKPKS